MRTATGYLVYQDSYYSSHILQGSILGALDTSLAPRPDIKIEASTIWPKSDAWSNSSVLINLTEVYYRIYAGDAPPCT
jgi:hypothetical protein